MRSRNVKLLKKSEDQRQVFLAAEGPWHKERIQNHQDKRTRTFPDGGPSMPFPAKDQMKLKTREDNTVFYAHDRDDLILRGAGKLQDGLRTDQHMTEQQIRDSLKEGLFPGVALTKKHHPHHFDNAQDLLPTKQGGKYYNYPVAALHHTKGKSFDYSKTKAKKGGPWRGMTDENQNYVGVIVHNPRTDPKPDNFFIPKQYKFGSAQSNEPQYPPHPLTRRKQTAEKDWKTPLQQTRRRDDEVNTWNTMRPL